MTGQEPAPAGRSAFTAGELAYLRSQRLAWLATVDRSGCPQNSPVSLHYNPGTDTIDIIGWNLAASRKYRNVFTWPYVALVVDGMPVKGAPCGIEICGQLKTYAGSDPGPRPGQLATPGGQPGVP